MGKQPAPKELAEVFKQAAEIAAVVPESMHEVAFSRAVDEIMRNLGFGRESSDDSTDVSSPRRSDSSRRKSGAKGKADPPEQDRGHIMITLIEDMDRTKFPEVKASSSVLDRSLHVLRAARDDHGVDGLTPPEVSKILVEKFRVSTSRQAVSMALAGAGEYVNRRPVGNGYLYKLMQPGDDYLDSGPAPQDKDGTTRPPGRKARKKKSSASAPKKKSDTQGESPKRRSSVAGRPSPKQLLESLLLAGFFDSAQTIGSVIAHIKSRRGHTYKATDLSPAFLRLLRDGQLTREKNATNQYEYTRSS